MWRAFRAALTSFVVTPCDQDEIVSAAKGTFLKLHRWIETGASQQ
jgi:heme oxygenase